MARTSSVDNTLPANNSNALTSDLRSNLTVIKNSDERVYDIVAHYGADNTGATDARTAIATANTDSGSSGIIFPPGTYKISSNVTITNGIFLPGSMLSVDTGVTVTIEGIQAGNYRIFTLNGTGIVSITYGTINCIWYASSGDGISNPWVNALRNAHASNGGSHHYHLPAGVYQDTTTITVSGGRIRITGDGGIPASTIVKYEKTDGTAALQIGDDTNVEFFDEISDIKFIGGSAGTGGAINVKDASTLLIENVWITAFTSATSYGIKVEGRDAVTIRKVYINGAFYPIYLTHNANTSGIDVDHFHLEDLILAPGITSGIALYIDADQVNDFVMDGTNVIANALHGIYFDNNAGTPAAGNNFKVSGLGTESGEDNTGWGIYFNPGNTMTGVTFDHVWVGGAYNGIYARNADNLTISNCQAGVDGTYTSYNVDGATVQSSIVFINSFKVAASTFTVGASTSKKLVFAADRNESGTDTFMSLQVYGDGYFNLGGSIQEKMDTTTWVGGGATTTMSPDLKNGNIFYVNASSNAAGDNLTINLIASSVQNGVEVTFIIQNSSGGALQTVTWNAGYKHVGGVDPVKPATGTYMVVRYVRVAANTWLQIAPAAEAVQ